jgi:hypothetical protein
MYRYTAGNAVTYEATNKPEETSKSGQKRVYFPDDKDSLEKLATLKVCCFMSILTPLVD